MQGQAQKALHKFDIGITIYNFTEAWHDAETGLGALSPPGAVIQNFLG